MSTWIRRWLVSVFVLMLLAAGCSSNTPVQDAAGTFEAPDGFELVRSYLSTETARSSMYELEFETDLKPSTAFAQMSAALEVWAGDSAEPNTREDGPSQYLFELTGDTGHRGVGWIGLLVTTVFLQDDEPGNVDPVVVYIGEQPLGG